MSENKAEDCEKIKPIKQNKPKKKRKKNSGIQVGPKRFLTGYVRYMNDNREIIRQKNPDLNSVEITKLVADTWTKLPENEKKPYLEAAELDKERYNKEILEFNNQQKQAEDNKSKKDETPPSSNSSAVVNTKRTFNGEIPIFSEEFLEHNKSVETELRVLRKNNLDYEAQNSVLEKHIENMNNGIEKLKTEIDSTNSHNAVLESYLTKLKSTLESAYHNLSVPNENPSEDIVKYMLHLQEMIKSNTHNSTVTKAINIARKLDIKSNV